MELEANSTKPQILGGLPPPSGVTPNLVYSFNVSEHIITSMVVCLTFSTLLVWTRLYIRFYITKSHGWDDYTSFAAWLGLVAYSGVCFVSLNYGAGIHQWNVPLEHVKPFLKLAYATEIFYAVPLFTTKLSVLLTYLRIFVPAGQDSTYYAIYLLIWINLLYYVAQTLIVCLECIPLRKTWDPTIPGHCLNTLRLFIVTCVINIVSDFSILLVPINKIWHLQISVKRKMGLSAVFALGLCACLSSVMRLVETIKAINSKDLTYLAWGIWTVVEITCGILCGCLPVIPRFFTHFNFRLPFRLSFISRAWKRGSPVNLSPFNSSAGKSSVLERASWSSQKIKGTYLELGERSDDRVLLKNARSAESCSYSAEASAVGDRNTKDQEDLERGVPESGIRKMVRIETTSC